MKHYRRFQQILRNAVLAALIFVLSTEPMLAAAKAPETDLHAEAVNTLVVGGEAYLGSASKAMAESMELLGYLNTIQATPVNKISESYISDAIARALLIAEETSVALGSVGVVTGGIEQLGGTLPGADNISEAVGTGFSQEMRNELSALGMSAANIDQASASASELYAARQGGISASAQTNLRRYGFTQAQIDQIALAVSKRGLLDNGLTTRLEQFKATQDELADTRTGMVILAVQLLGYQIAARQAKGIAPRSITEEELQALAEDELRLLVHAAHLSAAWGSDPSNDIGEGDWWFIEHYAGRAAERLQTATVESQNRSLVAELFVLRQMKMLAVSARTGDAVYAKAELNGLVALLNRRLNTRSYYQERQNPGWVEVVWARVTAMPALRESVEWPIPEPVAKNARLILRERVDALGAENILGSFDETNEDNNIGGLLLAAGLSFSQLDAGTINETLNQGDGYVEGNAWTWLYAIMTGDTDNPFLLLANIIIGFIPVVNILSDVWTLLSTPHILMKAIAIVALICDIGSTAAFLTLQAELIGLPWLGKAAASVTSGLARANRLLLAAFNGMKLGKAVEAIVQLLGVVVKKIGDNVLGHSLGQVISKIGDLLNGALKIWENFSAFAIRAEWDLIVRLGINDSTLLVGRVIKTGASISDDALVALKFVGDDLIGAGIELSDDAAKGLGRAASMVNDTEIRSFVNRLVTTCVGFKPATYKLARPALGCDPDLLESVLTSIGRFDDATLTAASRLNQKIGLDDFGTFMGKYASDPDNLGHVRGIFEGLTVAGGKYGGKFDEALDLARTLDINGPRGLDEAEDLGRYLMGLARLDDLAQVTARQGFEVSKLANIYDFDFHVAGRLGDTADDIALRGRAAQIADPLVAERLALPMDQLPENIQQLINQYPSNRREIIDFWTRQEVVQEFNAANNTNLAFFQARVSSGKPEVDVFFDLSYPEFRNLNTNNIEDVLTEYFNVPPRAGFEVDIYNTDWAVWGDALGLPDPRVIPPPSAVIFKPDGTIIHPPLGN